MGPAKTKVGYELKIPIWVPQAARTRIIELRTSPQAITDANQQLLKRLATYDSMRTEVWEKLPSNPKMPAGEIIEWAFFAYTVFHSFPRRHGKGKAQWWITHYSQMTHLCVGLAEGICKCKSDTELYWPRFWEGDRTINADKALSILDHLREFYLRMHEEYEELLHFLPQVNRWNDKAHQKFFTEYLSAQMKKAYGRPFDSIVAALGDVAFDLHDGIGSETVRGRRRIGKAPEKLRQKAR
jgi:hypothetical protein